MRLLCLLLLPFVALVVPSRLGRHGRGRMAGSRRVSARLARLVVGLPARPLWPELAVYGPHAPVFAAGAVLVRPYVLGAAHRAHRGAVEIGELRHGDGLDDLRAELAPLVRDLLARREV
ncbi:hypothetical protein, partial [Allosalinactinospora lopnorensis]|uniref:hypothetical protein n=1 Tax=Allosalinactinospora lopnorensis TaxID=1352348 RepID=UPI0012E2688F